MAHYSKILSLSCLDITPLYPKFSLWGQSAPCPGWQCCCTITMKSVQLIQAAVLSTALPSSFNRWIYFWNSRSFCERHSLLKISGLGIKSAERLATCLFVRALRVCFLLGAAIHNLKWFIAFWLWTIKNTEWSKWLIVCYCTTITEAPYVNSVLSSLTWGSS